MCIRRGGNRNRKQKKRRTRRKRGGLTPSQTKQCVAAGIPGFPPQKCEKYLQDLKNKPVVVPTTATVKPSKAVPCEDDDTATYGKNKKGNCKNLREKQAFIDKVCKDQAGQHCIKTCGTCDKKICTINGGGRRRRRKSRRKSARRS